MLPWRGRELSCCQAGAEPPADLRRPAGSSVLDLGHPHSYPRAEAAGSHCFSTSLDPPLISPLPSPTCPPLLKQGVKSKEGGGLSDILQTEWGSGAMAQKEGISKASAKKEDQGRWTSGMKRLGGGTEASLAERGATGGQFLHPETPDTQAQLQPWRHRQETLRAHLASVSNGQRSEK